MREKNEDEELYGWEDYELEEAVKESREYRAGGHSRRSLKAILVTGGLFVMSLMLVGEYLMAPIGLVLLLLAYIASRRWSR